VEVLQSCAVTSPRTDRLLEKKIQTKDEVLAETMVEDVALRKKTLASDRGAVPQKVDQRFAVTMD